MNDQQFEALLMDEALGELPEDVSALVDAYLSQRPELNTVAEQIREAVAVTERVVVDRPQLIESGTRHEESVARALPEWASWLASSFLTRKAIVVATLVAAAGLGFFAGKYGGGPPGNNAPSLVEQKDEVEFEQSSPWTRYRLQDDGRLAVVAVLEPQS